MKLPIQRKIYAFFKNFLNINLKIFTRGSFKHCITAEGGGGGGGGGGREGSKLCYELLWKLGGGVGGFTENATEIQEVSLKYQHQD